MKFVKIFWLCVPHTLFSGQKSDETAMVVLTLGVRVLLFSCEGAEVSVTDPFSWLSYSISFKLWAFGSNHGAKADFPLGLFSILPEIPLFSKLWFEWNIGNANNPIQYFLIANYDFQ